MQTLSPAQRRTLRAKAHAEKMRGGREAIIISELPYQVNKATLIEKISELSREKRIEGLSEIRDESSREGIRVVLELGRGEIPQIVMNQLYKHTQMQTTFGIIMPALEAPATGENRDEEQVAAPSGLSLLVYLPDDPTRSSIERLLTPFGNAITLAGTLARQGEPENFWQSVQLQIALRVEGHGGDNAHAEAQLDVGLDHVGIHRLQHHVGREAGLVESLVDVGAAGVARFVGDDRKTRQLLQRKPAATLRERPSSCLDRRATPLSASAERWATTRV
jgi:hypothetical protein